MIARLTVKNFKGLADFQLPPWTSAEAVEFQNAPRLGPLVILIGPNSNETISAGGNETLLAHTGGQCQVEDKGYDFSALGSVLSVLRLDSLCERLQQVKTN